MKRKIKKVEKGRGIKNINFSFPLKSCQINHKPLESFAEEDYLIHQLKRLAFEQAELKDYMKTLLSEIKQIKELITAYYQREHLSQVNVYCSPKEFDKNFFENEIVPFLETSFKTSTKRLFKNNDPALSKSITNNKGE